MQYWPGYFAARLEQQLGGRAMFLVGDNGSEEDPITVPALPKNDADPYPQAKATPEIPGFPATASPHRRSASRPFTAL